MKCKEWVFSWSASLETKLDFLKRLLFEFSVLIQKITSSWRISIQSTLQAFWFGPHVGLAHRRWGGVGLQITVGEEEPIQNRAEGAGIWGCSCVSDFLVMLL